jgi:hypothetical protein
VVAQTRLSVTLYIHWLSRCINTLRMDVNRCCGCTGFDALLYWFRRLSKVNKGLYRNIILFLAVACPVIEKQS